MKRKIIFLSENRWERAKGGAELQLHLQKKILRREGFTVLHININNRAKALEIKKTKKITSFIFGPLKLQYIFVVLRLLFIIKPEIIIHRDLSSFGLPGLIYCLIKKKKFILQTAHDKDFENFYSLLYPRQATETFIKTWMFRNASHILVQTEDQLKKYLTSTDKKNAQVMRNVVLAERDVYRPVPKGKIKIVWVANIKPDKNLQGFIKLAKLFSDRTDFCFSVIGKFYGDDESKNLLSEINQLRNVHYLGELSQAEVLDQIENSNFLCSSSLREGFPNTFLQAWSLGKPVISMYVDPDDVIERFGLGIVNSNINKIQESILAVVNSDEKYNYYSASSLKYVQKYHSRGNHHILVNICCGENRQPVTR